MGFWSIALRQIRRYPQQWQFWWLLVIAPALCCGLLWLLMGSGLLRDLPVALLDSDHSPLSRQVARWVDASPSMRISHVVTDPAEGEQLLRTGQVYALIIVPRNFETDIHRKRPVRIIAYLEGQHMVTAGVLSRDLSDLGLNFWKEQDVLTREKNGLLPSVAKVQASTLSLDIRPIGNPSTNYRLFLLPGQFPAILQILLGLSALFFGYDLCVQCRRDPRLAQQPKTAVLATFAPLALWFCLLCFGLTGFLLWQNDLQLLGPSSCLLLGYSLFVLASLAMGLLIMGLTSTLIQGLSIVSVFVSPAFAFAGLTFPLGSMPLAAQIWASLLPLTHVLTLQVHCGQLGASLQSQAISVLALLTQFFLCLLLALPLVGRMLTKNAQEGLQEAAQATTLENTPAHTAHTAHTPEATL